MTKLKNLLHCYAMGMGIKGISSAFHLSRNTVRKYVRLFQESGIPMAKLMELSPEAWRQAVQTEITKEEGVSKF